MRRPTLWDLAGCAVAAGGVTGWAVAWAARAGLLRAVLEWFPRSSWDGVTWGLLPAVLLLPSVIQGLATARCAGVRPAPLARAVAGSAAGSVAAAAVLEEAALAMARRLPAPVVAHLAPAVPGVVATGSATLVLAGSLLVAARLAELPWLRAAALPLAAAVVALGWLGAYDRALALAYVLDRPEMSGLVASVVTGGTAGSAWMVWLAGARPAAREPVPRRGARPATD